MATLVTTALAWGPTAYYALRSINNLIGPTIIQTISGTQQLAKKLFPQVFKDEERLRDDIVVYKVDHLNSASVLGTNFGPAAVLFVNKDLSLMDPEAFGYICKHELSHIHSNDGLVTNALASAVSAVAAFTIPFLKSNLPWWIAPISYFVPFITGFQTYDKAATISENRADRFAIRHATTAELRGIERFVTAEIEVNKSLQKDHPNLFTTDGNTQLRMEDSTHGSLTARLAEIKQEIEKRNLPTPRAERHKLTKQMDKIRKFHEGNYKTKLKINL